MRTQPRHRAVGKVVRTKSHEGIEGLAIEAWDDTRFVARTRTRIDGRFVLSFPDHFLRAVFADRAPTLMIKVLHDGKAVHEGIVWKPGAKELVFEVDHAVPAPQPNLQPLVANWDPNKTLKVDAVPHPLPKGTLGTIGKPVKVDGPDEFPQTLLRLPYSPAAAQGVDPTTARLFRWDEETKTLRAVWNSGINVQLGFMWGKIRRSGV